MSISHWYDNRRKLAYKVKQRLVNADSEHLNSNYKIKEVLNVESTFILGYSYMTKIVMVGDDRSVHDFAELDFKYLNINDIEDFSLLYMHKKLEHFNTFLLDSLLVFIQTSVILGRVQDFQLGIESYQWRVNLTFEGIENHDYYTVISDPKYS